MWGIKSAHRIQVHRVGCLLTSGIKSTSFSLSSSALSPSSSSSSPTSLPADTVPSGPMFLCILASLSNNYVSCFLLSYRAHFLHPQLRLLLSRSRLRNGVHCAASLPLYFLLLLLQGTHSSRSKLQFQIVTTTHI